MVKVFISRILYEQCDLKVPRMHFVFYHLQQGEFIWPRLWELLVATEVSHFKMSKTRSQIVLLAKQVKGSAWKWCSGQSNSPKTNSVITFMFSQRARVLKRFFEKLASLRAIDFFSLRWINYFSRIQTDWRKALRWFRLFKGENWREEKVPVNAFSFKIITHRFQNFLVYISTFVQYYLNIFFHWYNTIQDIKDGF